MTSRSRTEPPGCTTAVTPASVSAVESVGEGEEGVRCGGPAARELSRFHDGDTGGHDARLLPCADADGNPVARDHDRV